MHPMVPSEIAKMRMADRRAEVGGSGRPAREGRWRAIGWRLVGAGIRLAGSRTVVRRIEGGA